MRELTDRQLAVLRFIEHSRRTRGYSPTNREIGEAFDIKSTNGVNDHLKALELKQCITRGEMQARSIVPTPTGLKHVNPVNWPLDAAGLFDAVTVPSGSSDPLKKWWVLRGGHLLAEGHSATEAIQRAVQLRGVQR